MATKVPEYTFLPVELLRVNTKSPRLHPDTEGADEAATIKALGIRGVLDEIAASFAYHGYLRAHPMIVVKEGNAWVVIDGNRRLAALMSIHKMPLADGLHLGPRKPTKFTKSQLKGLIMIPCLVFSSRKEAEQHMGPHHIGTSQRWDIEAEAQYTYEHVEAQAKAKAENPFQNVAAMIGTYTATVRDKYTAFAILRRAQKLKIDGKILEPAVHSFYHWFRFVSHNKRLTEKTLRLHPLVTYKQTKRRVDSYQEKTLLTVFKAFQAWRDDEVRGQAPSVIGADPITTLLKLIELCPDYPISLHYEDCSVRIRRHAAGKIEVQLDDGPFDQQLEGADRTKLVEALKFLGHSKIRFDAIRARVLRETGEE